MRTAHSSLKDQRVLEVQQKGTYAGKRGRPFDLIVFCIWLIERMTWVTVEIFWTNYRVKQFLENKKQRRNLLFILTYSVVYYTLFSFFPFFPEHTTRSNLIK